MDAIVIMAKEPKPYKVKTRLTPQLDPETAAKLYYNFVLDRIDQVNKIQDPQRFIAYTPESAKDFFIKIIPSKFNLITQMGKDLGERLTNVSINLFDQGFEKVVIMDSDSPNLPSRLIKEAFVRLDSVEIVLGACEDGGYYLIGMKSSMPNIFKNIPWSTQRVTSTTQERANELGLKIGMLDKWYDVDTYYDVLRLNRDLDDETIKEKGAFNCKNTIQFLSENL